MDTERTPAGWKIIAAFAALYVIWGSTYLAIKIAIETMPPLLMASGRFLVAGSILFAWARLRGAKAPSVRQWRQSIIVGAGLIAGGNGVVTLAERWIDSSMAALIIASNPLFMTLFSWLSGLEQRPGPRVWASLVMGFAGVAFLLFGSGGISVEGQTIGYFLVVLAVISWTVTSVYSKRVNVSVDPWLQSGMQMMAGGAVCLIVGLAFGELGTLDFGSMSARSLGAFGYLFLVGSLIGFSSFVFLLKHCSPSAVSSHAYVNPAVALALGWLALGERLTLYGWVGSALVLVAVFALLKRRRAVSSPRPVRM